MHRKVSIILFLIFVTLLGYAQDFNYKLYTVDDGLPSNDIYDIVEDTNGYIWFATEYGVCRFDGYEFKRYSIDEGLPELSSIKLFIDRNNILWVSTLSGHLAYFKNDSFFVHSFKI